MPTLSVNEIREILPHRYPMLMVDKVVNYGDDWLIAVKNITANDPIFQGHFPHWPIFPGVLILEAMVQASAVMSSLSLGAKADEKRIYLFAGVDNARFKRQVVPGDSVQIETRTVRRIRKIWKTEATAKVDDAVVCSADLLFTYKEL